MINPKAGNWRFSPLGAVLGQDILVEFKLVHANFEHRWCMRRLLRSNPALTKIFPYAQSNVCGPEHGWFCDHNEGS
jgi:hypothetical protein